MQSLTGAASPYLCEWEVAASQGDVPRSIMRSLYVTLAELRVAHTKNQLDLLRCLATMHEHYRQPDGQTDSQTDGFTVAQTRRSQLAKKGKSNTKIKLQ